jgi:1-acyl-sn-glycerol-3-phosphate acyltransferase
MKDGFYAAVVFLLHLILRVLFRLRVEGRTNISQDEGYIAVARHRSYWDIPIMAVALGCRNRVHFIARRGLMRANLLFQPLLRIYTTIIDREKFGKSDFRRMLESIRQERLIGIFPEGTTRQKVDAKAGAVYFAELAQKAILPINIRVRGAYPPRYPFGFPKVIVSIGAPVDVATLDAETGSGEPRSRRLREMSERLMELVDHA